MNKKRMKHFIQRSYRSNIPPIVVASMGRSGSTVVSNSVRLAVASARFPKFLQKQALRFISENAWDLSRTTFINGIVYKTHGLAGELSDGKALKVIFLFGSASDAAMSVLNCHSRYGQAWIDKHFEHLRASGSFSEIGERDVLRFGDQLDGWIGKIGTERLILHYDALWENRDVLSDFVGLRVDLPEKRQRLGSEGLDIATVRKFRETYSGLDEYIASLPQIQILS